MNLVRRIKCKRGPCIDPGSEDSLVIPVIGEILPVIENLIKPQVKAGRLRKSGEYTKKQQDNMSYAPFHMLLIVQASSFSALSIRSR